jgi:hypothetical protein
MRRFEKNEKYPRIQEGVERELHNENINKIESLHITKIITLLLICYFVINNRIIKNFKMSETCRKYGKKINAYKSFSWENSVGRKKNIWKTKG